MEPTRVELNLAGLHKFARFIDSAGPPPGHIADALRQWGVRYRGFAQRRFDRYSKGGGDWPALHVMTIAARRGGAATSTKKQSVGRRPIKDADGRVTGYKLEGAFKKVKSKKGKTKRVGVTVSILRDKGLLFAGLLPTFTPSMGAVETIQGFSILVGYGGPAKHGDDPATIADIASFHDTGAGRLPKREIIVPPPDDVVSSMARDMERGLKRLADDTIGGPSV